MKRKVIMVLAVILPIMFAIGCSDDGASNNGYLGTQDPTNPPYTGGETGEKKLFHVGVSRDTTDGTYDIGVYAYDIYPFPKLLVNGVETVDNDYGNLSVVELEKDGISAGDLTYSIIWDGDTLKRTINLPSNFYILQRGTIGEDSLFSYKGGNGYEKVIWQAEKRDENYNYSYIRDTLSINENFIVPSDYHLYYSRVMHEDWRILDFGYSATAEKGKIAVWENISLWYWNYYN